MKESFTEQKKAPKVLYLSDLWRGFVKFWWVGAALALLLGGAMFYRTYIRYRPLYRSAATFTVSTQSVSGTDGFSQYSFHYDQLSAAQLCSTFPQILKTNLLQDAVCAELGVETMPITLLVEGVENTNMFTMTAIGRDPVVTYNTLLSCIRNYPDAARSVIGNAELTMIVEPQIADKPSNKTAFISRTLFAVAVGLAGGLCWIVLYAAMRKTVRTREDITAGLNRKTIAVLQQVTFKKYNRQIDRSILLTNRMLGENFKETIRVFRNSVIHALGENEKVLMITGTAPGEGKTTVLTNLAISLAQAGKNVLLVDADIRNASIRRMLRIEQDEEPDAEALYTIRSIEELQLSILTFNIAKRRFGHVMRVEQLKELLDPLRDTYDYILIDTPPCGLISDAFIVAQLADAALYVIYQDAVRMSRIRSSMDALLNTDIHFLGCVLNGATSGAGGYGDRYGGRYGYGGYRTHYGGYGYGYGYGTDSPSDEDEPKSSETP